MFVRGSTELLPGQEASLRAFARTIPPEFTLAVHGMASEEGPGPYNRALSRHRAERVIAILDEAGVPESRVAVILVHGAVPGDRPRHRAVVIDMTPPPTREPSLTPEPVPEDKPGITPLDVIKQVAPSDVGMKFEEEFTYPTKGYRPAGPIMWRLKLKFSFDGAVKGNWPGLKMREIIAKGKEGSKWELSKSLPTEMGKVSFKVASDGKVGVEWNSKGSPWYDLLGDHLSVDSGFPILNLENVKKGKLDVADLNIGGSWELDLLKLLHLPHPEGVSMPGKVTVKGGIGITANPAYWAARAAASAAPEVVAGATAAEVALGVALPVGMVAFVGYGLYELNEAHRRGRLQAMREAFADGYAEILAQATNPHPWVRADLSLLDVDAEQLYAMAVDSYVSGGGPGFAEAEAARIAGRAAAAQAILEYLELDPSSEALARLGADQRRLFGGTEPERASRYRATLRAQARGGGAMGIPLRQ